MRPRLNPYLEQTQNLVSMNVPEAIESLRASWDGVGTATVECVRYLRSEVRPRVPVTEFGEGHCQVVAGCLLHLCDTLAFSNPLLYVYI